MLNGGSSSGKSGIARCLQAILPEPWLTVGVDMLVEVYDLTVHTTRAESLACAQVIAARLR